MATGQVVSTWDGLLLFPPLTRTSAGWTEPSPTPCGSCGSRTMLVGWLACSCRTDTLAPGHRTWTCYGCGHREALGCLGAVGRGPMEEYGCAN